MQVICHTDVAERAMAAPTMRQALRLCGLLPANNMQDDGIRFGQIP